MQKEDLSTDITFNPFSFRWTVTLNCYVYNCAPTSFPSILLVMHRVCVADDEAGRFLDPEGNGVSPSGGNGGGPGPPDGEQDKQLISSRGGGNTLTEQAGRLEEESSVTKETHRARSM
jgi:hypothetical protein